jgi:hypothetical protein
LQGQAPRIAQGVVQADDVDPEVARHGLDDLDNTFELAGNTKQ